MSSPLLSHAHNLFLGLEGEIVIIAISVATSDLYGVSSPIIIRLLTVLLSTNFRMFLFSLREVKKSSVNGEWCVELRKPSCGVPVFIILGFGANLTGCSLPVLKSNSQSQSFRL